MKFEYAKGATPIDPNEEKDLIPSNITTQSQLNEVEYENVAFLWEIEPTLSLSNGCLWRK